MAITSERLAASGSESGEQKALFCWTAQSRIPELRWLFAIPNGGLRNPITGARLKAEGVRKGVSDVMLPVRGAVKGWIKTVPGMNPIFYHGLFIEMKKKGGKSTPEQLEFGQFVSRQGYKLVVCYSWIEAKDAILQYLGKI